jgi:hypothetical protein
MKHLFIYLILITNNCNGQQFSVRQIDSILEKQVKYLYYKKSTSKEQKRFYFFQKNNNNIFRIWVYKSEENRTYNYLFIDNSLARVDVAFRNLNKKHPIYYYNNGKIILKINTEIIEIDEAHLLVYLNELLKDVDKLRNH